MSEFDPTKNVSLPDEPKELHEIILPQPTVQDLVSVPEPVQDQVPAVVVNAEPVALPHKAERVGLGNPLRKTPLITPAMAERIKRKELKQKERTAKKKLLKEQASKANVATNTVDTGGSVAPIAITQPDNTPPQLVNHGWKPGQSGNPSGRPKQRLSKEAIDKVIFNAKNNLHDPETATKFEALCKKAYDLAMDSNELDLVLQAIEKFSLLADGKPVQDISESGDPKSALTININATRFAVQPAVEKGDVIEVDCVHGS